MPWATFSVCLFSYSFRAALKEGDVLLLLAWVLCFLLSFLAAKCCVRQASTEFAPRTSSMPKLTKLKGVSLNENRENDREKECFCIGVHLLPVTNWLLVHYTTIMSLWQHRQNFKIFNVNVLYFILYIINVHCTCIFILCWHVLTILLTCGCCFLLLFKLSLHILFFHVYVSALQCFDFGLPGVLGIAFGGFLIGVLLIGALWFIKIKTGKYITNSVAFLVELWLNWDQNLSEFKIIPFCLIQDTQLDWTWAQLQQVFQVSIFLFLFISFLFF